MTLPRVALLLCLPVVSLLALAAARAAPPARLVEARVVLGKAVVLQASTSDDGHPDADAVWGYLDALPLRPTEAFAALEVGDDQERYVLEELSEDGLAVPLVVEITYGGRAEPRRVTLVRLPPDERGAAWGLDAAELDGLFASRLISRRLAAALEHPALPKR